MKKVFVFAVHLFVVAAIGGVVLAQDEEKPSKKATSKDYEKFAKLGPTYTGKLSGVGPKSVSFRIDDSQYQEKVKWAAKQPNPTVANKKVEADFANVKWALGKDFEFEFSEKVELRKLKLPFEYDDKGFPKKYTPAEQAKLKGNPSLPGYVAKSEDFTPGKTATATFGKLVNGRPTVTLLIVDDR